MGLFGPKRIECPANVATTIISTSLSKMWATWSVQLTTSDGTPVSGFFEEKKSAWILPGTPSQGPLRPAMTFHRGLWNTFYSVTVCPTTDCVAIID